MNDDIQFLKDLQNELKNQEIDGQAAPRFWVIMDYRIVPGNDEYDSGFDEYIHNDGDLTKFRSFEDLKRFIEEYYEEEIESDRYLEELLGGTDDIEELWAYVEENLNDDDYFSKVFVKEESFIVPDTMFLTKEEAKRHLELNHYHYSPKAHTHAMTAWRAPKVERLLNILESFEWEIIEGDVNRLSEQLTKLICAVYEYANEGTELIEIAEEIDAQ